MFSPTALPPALDGLTFMPGFNFSGAAALQIVTNDQGQSGSGGGLTDTDTLPITVSSNVAPVVTASGGAAAYIENGADIAVEANR